MSSLPPPGTDTELREPEPPPALAQGDERDRPSDIPPWPAWTAPAAIGAGFGLWVLVSIVVGIGAKAGGSSISNPSPAVTLISSFLTDASFVAAAVYFARLATRIRPSDFGFRLVRWQTAIAGVFTAAVGYYVLTSIYASVLHFHGNEKLPKELGVGKGNVALIGATIFVCVVAPIAEEFFFRGFIFGTLRRIRFRVGGQWLGTLVAAIITAVLFGAAHIGSAPARYLIPLGIFGFVLCLLRWSTRSLYPCMALHSLNNSLALGVSELHWSTGEVVALMIGSLLVIAVLTGPLAARTPATV